MSNENKSLAQFIEESGIKITSYRHTLKQYDGTNHYKVTLINNQKRRITTPYFMGSAHTEPPMVDDILNLLAIESCSVENVEDLAEWMEDLGYTEVSLARPIYNSCLKQAKALKRWLGEDRYQELLYDVEGI